VGAVLVVLAQQGKPIGTDLSVVGKGKPSLVLAYENFSPAGAEALDRLRQVRADYEDRIAFVVADLGTPKGRAFARRHSLQNGVAVFLTPSGDPAGITGVPDDQRALRRQLDLKLARLGPGG
jgi:hypothetical protein